MKGLGISQAFFHEWGLPYMKRQFSELCDCVAAGLYGGSEVIGADDEWSRDHDWGPRFNLWLTTADYQRLGSSVSASLNSNAPETFHGYRYHFFGEQKAPVKVESIDGFFEDTFGWKYPPVRPREWFKRVRTGALIDKETWLYFLRHSPVFHDPLGEFSRRKKSFSTYPDDVRYRMIADVCLGIWADGEYKFCTRFIHRKDPFVNQIVVADIIRGVMRLCFLLEDDYAPNSYWLPHQFRRLRSAKTFLPFLNQLIESPRDDEKAEVILKISAMLRNRMAESELISTVKPTYGLGYDEIKVRIKDRWIRDTLTFIQGR